MQLVGRGFRAGSGYRYGFNAKENDNETSSITTYDYGFRIYSPTLARFLSMDPLSASYPWNSTYAFAENDVLRCIDLDGLEKYFVINCWKNGLKQRTEIEAYRDVQLKMEVSMRFTLSGSPLTDKDVLIYDVYEEGTKREEIFQTEAAELTTEQAKIYSAAFTIERLAAGNITIRNDLDIEVTDGKASSKTGLLHKQAIHIYNSDARNTTGKNLNKKIDLSPGVGTDVYMMSHDVYGDGMIHASKKVQNGTIEMTGGASTGLKRLINQIKDNGGVENVNITGEFNFLPSTSLGDRKTIKTGVENFCQNIKRILKSAGAKNVNVNINVQERDRNLGMRNVNAAY